jgi:hypothetical protein
MLANLIPPRCSQPYGLAACLDVSMVGDRADSFRVLVLPLTASRVAAHRTISEEVAMKMSINRIVAFLLLSPIQRLLLPSIATP